MLQDKARQSGRDSLFARLKRNQLRQPTEVHDHVAKRRLPPEFQELSELKEGKEFLGKLASLISEFREDESRSPWRHFSRKDVSIMTSHFVYGLCQLVHDMRDRKDLSPSRRKSFGPAVAKLLQVKDKMGERTGSELVELIFRILRPEDHQRDVQSRQWNNDRRKKGEEPWPL